jgi:hypothetical protein
VIHCDATRLSTLAFALALGSGCASLGPPARTSGPATAAAGAVELAVVGQDCTESPEHDDSDETLNEAIVQFRVRNGTSEDVTVRGDRFRLVTADGFALQTLTWGAAEPLRVSPGEASTLALRFMARGSLECDAELKLEARDGVLRGDAPVYMGAVVFVPRHPPTTVVAGGR